MRVITIPRFGAPDVLTAAKLPEPEPGPGEVAIDVAHAGVNYAEVLYRRGAVDVELPFVPGIEVSGHIRALGRGVGQLEVGQAVAALTIVHSGGYAEVVITDARLVVPLPTDATSDELALVAGVPSNTTTGIVVLEEVARICQGEAVLIHAAAGGVGSQLGQAAKLLGAGLVVGAVGSPAKVAAAEAFGYDEVLLRENVGQSVAQLTNDRGYDIVIDTVGGATRKASLDALALGGRLVVMGNASGAEDVSFAANALWFSGKGVLGFNLAALSQARPDAVGAGLRRALNAVRDGSMRVELADRLPLEQAAEAHRRIESGASIGKLVFDVRA